MVIILALLTNHYNRNNRGYDEAPDYFKLKDSKGNPILCHGCHLSAVNPSRAIIPCTYCSLSWHLDCLDPPLAKEPPPGRSWRCPAHVDDLLEQVPGSLGPAHRFRKIKGASLIKPVLARGVRNNGHIEIENATSDDEDQGSGFYEQREYGHVYKLPEEGIKLDFISRYAVLSNYFMFNLLIDCTVFIVNLDITINAALQTGGHLFQNHDYKLPNSTVVALMNSKLLSISHIWPLQIQRSILHKP